MPDEPPFTNEEVARELEREVAMRKHVYPRQVESGQLRSHTALRRIALMQAAAFYFRTLAEAEARKGRLL